MRLLAGENWKQWEGRIIGGQFPLQQCLSACEHSAVFLTVRADGERRKAAIRLIPADRANADLQLSRWRLSAKLHHPHLIRLFETGRCQLDDTSMVYVVMEYAEEDLSQVVPHRPLTQAEAREMLEPALTALAYVHREGFLHGRLKPSNIMAADDRLKLSTDGLCPSGEPFGSVRRAGPYDAPEVAGGVISPAADVWSLGMTLVEALTQRLPVWNGHDRKETVLPEALPAPFVDIARHCLRQDPRRRWTVREIAERLGRPRRRFIVPAAALGLGLAGAIAALTLVKRHPESRPAPSNPPVQQKVQPRPDRTPPAFTTKRPALSKPADAVPVEILHRVLPDVPRTARNGIKGKIAVSVRIRVSPAGRVSNAKLNSPGPSRYFAELALQAARRWKFTPARSGSSEWNLRFEFRRSGTAVVPVRAAA